MHVKIKINEELKKIQDRAKPKGIYCPFCRKNVDKNDYKCPHCSNKINFTTKEAIVIIAILTILFATGFSYLNDFWRSNSQSGSSSHVNVTVSDDYFIDDDDDDAESISDYQKKELTVFSMKAIGVNASIGMVKNVMSDSEVNHMVAAGINANGYLCADVVDIIPLKMKSKYEIECIAYRSGRVKKSYIIDSIQGVAFAP